MMHGWALVGWTALFTAGWIGLVLARTGASPEGLHQIVLGTARESALLFLGAFLASSLRSLRRNAATAWLLRNRRYVGVSFAVSHAFHLAAIVAFAPHAPEPWGAGTWVPGGIAYVFIAAMTATSNDRAFEALGRQRWRLLHVTGAYVIWAVFLGMLAPRASEDPVSLALTLAFAAAAPLRLVQRRRVRSGRDGAAH